MKLTVIGGGPGGYEAAVYAAKCGAEVVLVEKGSLGGTCLNVGCIPTKALLAVSDTLHAIETAGSFGIAAAPVTADYAAAVARKNQVVATLVGGVEYTLTHNGVRLVRGVWHLNSNRGVTVELTDGCCEGIESDAILLPTGSAAAAPGFLTPDGQNIITSNELLALTRAPADTLIVGGGVIGCEIGQFLARMGTQVTIVELLSQLLPTEDEDVAKVLSRQFRREGVQTLLGCGISSVSSGGGSVQATLADSRVLQAEKMLVAIGR